MGVALVVGVAGLVLLTRSAPAEGAAKTIRGIVVNAAGEPVANATVSLRTPRGGCIHVDGLHRTDATRTDDKGRFELPRPSAPMELYVRSDGRDSDWAPAWTAAEDGARIELKRGATLSVELPRNARVEVKHGYWMFARREADGIVEFGPLPPGVQLDVTVDSPERKRYLATLLLRPGERRTLKADLDRGHEIRGRVTPPLEGVRIEAHQGTGEGATAHSAADGTFVLTGLDERRARLVAIAPGKSVLVKDVESDENVELSWND
jgi:hypothetical protein